jgi:hypothetical protein
MSRQDAESDGDSLGQMGWEAASTCLDFGPELCRRLKELIAEDRMAFVQAVTQRILGESLVNGPADRKATIGGMMLLLTCESLRTNGFDAEFSFVDNVMTSVAMEWTKYLAEQRPINTATIEKNDEPN